MVEPLRHSPLIMHLLTWAPTSARWPGGKSTGVFRRAASALARGSQCTSVSLWRAHLIPHPPRQCSGGAGLQDQVISAVAGLQRPPQCFLHPFMWLWTSRGGSYLPSPRGWDDLVTPSMSTMWWEVTFWVFWPSLLEHLLWGYSGSPAAMLQGTQDTWRSHVEEDGGSLIHILSGAPRRQPMATYSVWMSRLGCSRPIQPSDVCSLIQRWHISKGSLWQPSSQNHSG